MKRFVLIVIIALMSFLISGCSGEDVNGNVVADSSVDLDKYVSISLSDLSDDVKFYEHNFNGVNIRYFAVLGSDGVPKTAFDACDVCGGYQGYAQQGGDIACRKCGRVFDIDGLGTQNKGYGCWPSYLPHTVEDGNVLIKKSDIDGGVRRFV